MAITIPLVCLTCNATLNASSIEQIEYVNVWGDVELFDVCPCCGDIDPGFRAEA